MTRSRITIVVAVTFAAGLTTGLLAVQPARTAPDRTLGMALLSAAVDSDGTLVHGAGVASSSRISAGTYLVRFDRNVRNCTSAAVHAGSSSLFGDINVVVAWPSSPSANVTVYTSNPGGPTNGPFHLIVFCAK
jgi:hypothetical protein